MNNSLTLPQKNMYETEKFYDKTSMCNVGGCIFFHESVDVDKLKKAINKLIENSDGLRIRIHEDSENVTQEFFEYKHENIECEKLSKDNYKVILEKWMQDLFDLSDKLYAFKIIDVDGKIGVFTKMHHLICDAWSATLVASKIAEYYQKLVNGEEIANDIYSYEKFVQRDSEYLESSKYEKDREFWNAKYENKPSFVSMSPDKKADLDVRAGRSSYTVPVKETEAIRKYCEENMISVAVLLEAVISLYASRINNADDITLCSLVINRSGNEEKNTIGMFNNILPLTVKVDYEQNFADFCKLISDEHYSMFRHQKYPLQNILDFVHENYGQDTQLYDIMVSYQNAQMTSDAETEWVFNGTSDLGFMMNISDRDDNGVLSFDFDYRLNCFTHDAIEKIYYRLINIVNQVVVNQEIKLKDIEIVTPYEKEQILVNFNDTIKEYPRNKCLHEFLEENVLKMPDKVALKFEGKEMTYSEFNTKVNQLADYIISRVDKRNAIIGVMLERSFDMMIAIYAVIKSGNCYMPIDPHFPQERIGFMLEDSQSPVILTNSKFAAMFADNGTVVKVDEFEFEKYSSANPKTNVVSTDTAYVIYTSGSTGKPKGAAIPHHSVINRIKWMHEKYPLVDGDVILQKTPYTFDVSVWELFWWSMYGGTLQILIPEGHKDPLEIVNCIEAGKVTHMHFVPSMLNAFLEYVDANPEMVSKLTTLKYVFSSGEALQSEQVRKFYNLFNNIHATLHNLYGPTECTVDVSYYDCEKDNIPDSIPIGKPVDNTQLLVLDKNRKLLPIGTTGELYISGDLVGKGYVNREELTNEKFVPNIYYNYAKMYRTGDLARWQEDGNIEYLGRIDFQIKIRGLRVELGDIENAILKYSGINQTIVVVFDVNNEKNLCAYYTSDTEIDEKDLRKTISKELPDYMVPNYYMRLDNIPVNNNGKADRKALPTPNVQVEEKDIVFPKNELEGQVLEIIKKVLKLNELSTEEDLFTVGLTSIGVISIITELSKLGHELRVRDFYECHTVVEIAEYLSNKNIDTDEYEDDEKNYSDVSDIVNYSIPEKEEGDIFITGATSFLGIHIIDELIRSTDKKVYCLIRNKEKFERFINRFTNLDINNERIISVMGDITKEGIGLSDDITKEIESNVSDIIHCAADVNFFCDWEKIKKTNYMGTCNVLKFAEKINAKLHHISTMSVSGDILTRQTKEYPTFTEKDLYIGQLYKENVYSHSKYLAEKEIIKAIRNKEVNASIYRIANLTWRASDGMFQENYSTNDLYLLTTTMLKYNKVPIELINENISLTPVDDCASSITRLMTIKENRVFHLFSKESMSIGEYIFALKDVDKVTMKEFYEELMKHEDDPYAQFAGMYVRGIINNTEMSVVQLDNSLTNHELAELKYEWSKLGDKYVDMFNKIGG